MMQAWMRKIYPHRSALVLSGKSKTIPAIVVDRKPGIFATVFAIDMIIAAYFGPMKFGLDFGPEPLNPRNNCYFWNIS
jgi:hypothetical protein